MWIYVYGWKALWPTSCRSKLEIDVWWRQQSILNLLGTRIYLRVLNTFFSLTLRPHHHRVLVFSSGNVYSVTNFLFLHRAPFVFTDYLFLVITMSNIVFVCGRYRTFILKVKILKIVLCIAGAINMDDCLWVNVSSWKPCVYTWSFWPRSHEKLYCNKQQKVTWSFSVN